jgi:DNA replication ATP-dependent helicase Dna2
MKPPELPEPIQNHRACGNCSYNIICTSLLKFENHDISNNKAIKEVQKDVTSHLKQTHLDYFLLWNNLLSMEAECNKDSKEMKEIYTSEPSKRYFNLNSIYFI